MTPHAKAALGELGAQPGRRDAIEIHQERRDPARHRRKPVEIRARRQPGQEPLAELAFPAGDLLHATEAVVISQRRDEAGQELVGEGARLEAMADRIGGSGPGFVRLPRLQHVPAAEGDAEVRTAELVGRAEHDVGVDRSHVHGLMRGILHGIHEGECAGLVGQLTDRAGVHDGANRVGRPREGDDFRSRAELIRQVTEVERGVCVNVGVPDAQAEVGGQVQPRRDVPIVIKPRYHDLVTWPQLAAEGSRQREVECGRAPAEDHLVSVATEEAGRGNTGIRHEGVQAAARRVGSPGVAAGFTVDAGDCLAHLVRYLGSTWRIEEDKVSP